MDRRSYFFDPSSEDRFNAQDIPTEQTMRRLTDSVAFHMELNSCASLTKAGIAKTTTDEKVNASDNNDVWTSAVTPVGATTFVRPAQIPLIKTTPNSGILLTRQVRTPGTATNTDLGGNIQDYVLALDPNVITANSITSSLAWSFKAVTGIAPSYTVTTATLAANSSVEQILSGQNTATNTIAEKLKELADVVDAMRTEYNNLKIQLGECVLTHTPSSLWSPNFIEPNGQTLSTTTYASLFALFGTTYNVGGEPAGTFRVPNWTNRVIRVAPQTGVLINGIGGSDTYTLTQNNIPLHNHAVNLTTSNAGVHNHTYVMKDDDDNTDDDSGYPETGNASGVARTGYTDNAGAHTHTVNGNTDNWGTNTPTPVDTLPAHRNIYLKMRAI